MKATADDDAVRNVQGMISPLDEEVSSLLYLRECVLFVGDTIASRLLDVEPCRSVTGIAHRATAEKPLNAIESKAKAWETKPVSTDSVRLCWPTNSVNVRCARGGAG